MMAAEASLEREKTPSRLPSAAPSRPDSASRWRRATVGGKDGGPVVQGGLRSAWGLLGEVCVRVLAEQLLFLQFAAPGVASRPGGPLEVFLPPIGQFIATKGRPVPVAEPPPQDAGESREKAPEMG